MASNLKVFRYEQQDPHPISRQDFFRLFNNYRVYKYILEILIKLDKVDFPNYTVFEPGCGSGSKLRFFCEHRVEPENCYGLEISQVAVDICKRWSPAGMNFQVGSVMETPYADNMFDIILCSGLFDCFNEDEEIKRVSKELERVLKPDGILFIVDVNENFHKMYGHCPGVMAKNLRPFDTQTGELEGLLEKEFTVVSRLPAFVVDSYVKDDGSGEFADVTDLPAIDAAIDKGEIPYTYTMWTFFKKFD